MRIMKKFFLVSGLIGLLASASLSVAIAPTTNAAAPAVSSKCDRRFLTFPAWYNGLVGPNGTCDIVPPSSLGGNSETQLSRFIWKIVLNVVDILLQAVAYVAVGFVIYGGFKYISSTGRPDKVKEGRELILNAVIGLVISIAAASIVGYIGANL